MKYKHFLKRAATAVLASFTVIAMTLTASAAEDSIPLPCTIYEFEPQAHYEFTSADTPANIADRPALGMIELNGNLKDAGQIDDCQTYMVTSGNISFSYAFDSAILEADDTDWHLTEDRSKKVDTVTLEKNILSGALIIQSSKDGRDWITDCQLSDVFSESSDQEESLYTTKDVQLENGCYYRIIVAYELQRKTGEKKILFMTTDVTEEKKYAEVYEFYAVNEKNAGGTVSAADEPRKELAGKPINTGKDNGYSGSEMIDRKDPHFGWQLGSFVINGYTRETIDSSNQPVYLKNVGDKVTLWFTLNEDITCLNGNRALSINEDKNGYDQAFGVDRTNFGHGALLISYTDYQGKTHDPIIYTDFLAANAQTGADTRVQLFEEGDYEVTLDYEIKNAPRKVAGVEVVPTYTNYKINFSFSIRNGNCMVYPFDTITGNELADQDITPNGFKLDMARSRYLTIDVARSVLNVNADGTISEDIRFNRPAKDNEIYEDEGIYTFTVTNLYTGSTTTKTLYVGTDKYYAALSKNHMTVSDLNEQLSVGKAVADDGSLVDEDTGANQGVFSGFKLW